MDHHESKGEVGLGIDPKVILFAFVKLDSVAHASSLSPPPKDIQHPLLEIDGDCQPVLAHHPGHRKGKQSHPTPNVHHRHARLDVGADDLLRVVEKAAEGIVDEIPTSPSTDMSGH
jgi:hypothetical protein